MSVTVRYAAKRGKRGSVEVQPATSAKYLAKRIAEAMGLVPDYPWLLCTVDEPPRDGKAFKAKTIVDDETVAADLDTSELYTIGVRGLP